MVNSEGRHVERNSILILQQFDTLYAYLIMLKRVRDFVFEHKYKLLAGISFGFAGYAFYEYVNDDSRIKLSSFIDALQQNQIDEVVVRGKTVFFRSQVSEWYHSSLGSFPVSQLFALLKNSQELSYSCEEDDQSFQKMIAILLAAGVSYATVRLLGPQKNFGSTKRPKIIDNQQNFSSFYGSQEVKAKLAQLVDYLRDQEKFKKLGARVRKGVLLYGPPGTGKTMLAKTLANQARLPFIQTCASEFQQIYVGVGAKKVRQIFQQARSCPEGCIVFIDELDAIGNRSEGNRFSRETTATINQLLTELDGFDENEKVVVIGATNRQDLVDGALIRAGRFDIKVKLDLPNKLDRKGILKTLLIKKRVPHELTEEAFDQIAQDSDRWSGADIQTLINQGVYKAVRKALPTLQNQQIFQAFSELRN